VSPPLASVRGCWRFTAPIGFIKERIEALRDAGVTHLHVNVVASDKRRVLEQVKEWIS
jgi:hypothetical protein